MKTLVRIIFFVLCTLLPLACSYNAYKQVDVLIIGGGASGTTAGIQSARMGVETMIIEESPWLGGMLTAAGVSAVDGNYNLRAGLWSEFLNKVSQHYGGLDSLRTGWVSSVLFEPSVGNKIFHELAEVEKEFLEVWGETTCQTVKQTSEGWEVIAQKKNGTKMRVKAKVLIDATELGDIAKQFVKYDIGMESKHDTHEDIAPDSANNIVQDLTYVAILKDYGKDVTIPRPEGYDPKEFACACSNPICVTPKEPNRVWSKDMMITYGKLPNNKYMINWPIEGNDYYINLIEMTPEERTKALQYAKDFTMRFIYFIQHELGYNHLALADDEFPTADKLPFIPYHRESRRIHGKIRFTLNHITNLYNQPQPLYRTSIAVGDYPVDHHHTRYHGYDELPNLYFHPIPSFSLPLGVMIPDSCKNLIVAEKSISVSNIVNGCTRLQPVVLQLGQAAGILGAIAVKKDIAVEKVSVRDVQDEVLAANGYLLPYLDVPATDSRFKSYQRIGSTGILKGVGKNVEWTNQTWLRADTVLLKKELCGIVDIYPYANKLMDFTSSDKLTAKEAVTLVVAIGPGELILQAPQEVAAHVDAHLHGLEQPAQVLLDVVDARLVVHKTVLVGVFVAHAVLGDENLLVVGVALLNVDEQIEQALGIDDPVPVGGGDARLVHVLANALDAPAAGALLARTVVVQVVLAVVSLQEAALVVVNAQVVVVERGLAHDFQILV